MKTQIYRTTVSLSMQSNKELLELCHEFRENKNTILQRAITLLHQSAFKKEKFPEHPT